MVGRKVGGHVLLLQKHAFLPLCITPDSEGGLWQIERSGRHWAARARCSDLRC